MLFHSEGATEQRACRVAECFSGTEGEDADPPTSDEIGRTRKRPGFGLNENALVLLQAVTHSITEKLSVDFIYFFYLFPNTTKKPYR